MNTVFIGASILNGNANELILFVMPELLDVVLDGMCNPVRNVLCQSPSLSIT